MNPASANAGHPPTVGAGRWFSLEGGNAFIRSNRKVATIKTPDRVGRQSTAYSFTGAVGHGIGAPNPCDILRVCQILSLWPLVFACLGTLLSEKLNIPRKSLHQALMYIVGWIIA